MHTQALVYIHVDNASVPIADDPAGAALGQDANGLHAHAGGHDPVMGRGTAAPLNVAQNGDPGIQPQLPAYLLAYGDAAGGALGHHDHEVGLAPQAGPTDLLHHLLFKVIGHLGYQHGGGAHGHSHIQGQIPRVAAHNLHHRAALVGLHGVPKAVNALHGRVGSGIEADGIVGADNVLVNGAGDTHHRDAALAQLLGAAKGAVAADGHHAVQPQKLAGIHGPLLARLGAELLAAGGIEHSAAAVDDAADAGGIHGHNVSVNKPAPAPTDTHALDAPSQGRADHGPDAGIHARSIAAAGEDADAFHCVFH